MIETRCLPIWIIRFIIRGRKIGLASSAAIAFHWCSLFHLALSWGVTFSKSWLFQVLSLLLARGSLLLMLMMLLCCLKLGHLRLDLCRERVAIFALLLRELTLWRLLLIIRLGRSLAIDSFSRHVVSVCWLVRANSLLMLVSHVHLQITLRRSLDILLWFLETCSLPGLVVLIQTNCGHILVIQCETSGLHGLMLYVVGLGFLEELYPTAGFLSVRCII